MLSHVCADLRQDPLVSLEFLIVYINIINTPKGAKFDTLAALLLSLVIPIPELPGPEVWNVRNAWLWSICCLLCHGQVDQEVELQRFIAASQLYVAAVFSPN